MARWSAVCAVSVVVLWSLSVHAQDAPAPVALPSAATASVAPAAVAAPEAVTPLTTPAAATPTVAAGQPHAAPTIAADAMGTVAAALTVEGAGLEVDGKFTAAKEGVAKVATKPGKHSVVVRQPGFVAVQGSVDVPPAGQVELVVDAPPYVRDRRPAVVLMAAGGVLALGAVALDAAAKYDGLGGDGLHWPLLLTGIGTFVGGTLWLKSIRDDEFDPPVGQGRLDVRVSVGPGVARLIGRF